MNFKEILIIITGIIFSVLFTVFGQEDNCPDPNCQSPCLSTLTQRDCRKRNEFIVADASLCGCCPGCRGGAVHGLCSESVKCAPGLKCVQETVTPQSSKCHLDKSTCAYTYHLKNFKQLPTCDVDGTFAAVQCKGDRINGRCFCYSETGERIYGWSWWKESKDQTCACSRLKHKLNLEGQYITLHCDQKGNFEPLQCNNGYCWCANIKTGELVKGTRVVPAAMWKFLPCYDIQKMGQKYLRQCESAAFAQYLIKKSLATHGTVQVEFNDVQCDYDGSYGSYVVNKNIISCQWKDGNNLAPYAAPASVESKLNCYCARDEKIYDDIGLDFVLKCNGNGNYEPLQTINGKSFCVDHDGFPVSEMFENSNQDICRQYLYYEAMMPS